jgi:hypothetical protein
MQLCGDEPALLHRHWAEEDASIFLHNFWEIFTHKIFEQKSNNFNFNNERKL